MEILEARIPRIITYRLTVRHIIKLTKIHVVRIIAEAMVAEDLMAAAVRIIDLDLSRLPNDPDAMNPAMTLRFAIEDRCRRVTDLEVSAK